jgi:hypothetical protein
MYVGVGRRWGDWCTHAPYQNTQHTTHTHHGTGLDYLQAAVFAKVVFAMR